MDDSFWKKRSENYDKLQWVRHHDFLDFFIKKCDSGNIMSSLDTLDIGTGPGIVPFKLSRLASEIIGIDISDAMISKALNNSEKSKQSFISFLKMNAENLLFPAKRFDLVTIRMALHHIDNVEKCLKEAYRVLRGNRSIVICEGLPPNYRVRDKHKEIFKFKENRHTFSEAELINHLDRVGFIDIELWPYFMRNMSLRKWIKESTIKVEDRNRVYNLYKNASDKFKEAYNIIETRDDILMDWKFAILRGVKE